MNSTRKNWPSVNRLVAPLVDRLVADAAELGLTVSHSSNGVAVIDAGIDCPGSYEAGRRIAEICMAGLGAVKLHEPQADEEQFPTVAVQTDEPVLSCLGSQYAGWSLEHKSDSVFRALGSGPARALSTVESLYRELGYQDEHDRSCMVIETSTIPPEKLMDKIASDCGIDTRQLALILTPTGSAAGVTQIAARVVEVAMHKAHVLEFPIHSIVSGTGEAIVAPTSRDFLTAMGRTNDSILYGGSVSLEVDCNAEAAQALATGLPSCNSPDYGLPFAQTFKNVGFDFYQIDPMLFSPARVAVHSIVDDEWFSGGEINMELLERSFHEGD